MIQLKAHAKINLTLEVLGKRDDGYHDIVSVLQTIDLADELRFEPHPEIVVECDATTIQPEENLARKAALALREALQEERGAKITLTKRIPTAAGLGGGSSDAAATLVGLSRLWEQDLSPGDMGHVAQALGSDVSFFLFGGTALVEGRGEIVTPLPELSETWAVLATPPIELLDKTARLYGALAESDYTVGSATRGLVLALRGGRGLTPDQIFNAFESVAGGIFPGFAEYRDSLVDAGAPPVHLAGSGPTLFALTENAEEAAALRERWDVLGGAAQVVKTVATPYNRA
ncbi:MAG: 4-(cytidine 5'-diphospho)-2-C-methyl-D-erythritol kinase [Chloroflexi bacterium]|nr:4-(cytidine 5'-diphospho)-2-C-methyl-D-erythritol kinase [Chloroflexota bacterium]